jgi:ribonuclease D
MTTPGTYVVEPEDAWKRIKLRGGKPLFLAILKELAAWREHAAQERDVPRSRVMRDDMLLDIAARAPRNEAELARTRSVGRSGLPQQVARDVIEAVNRACALPEKDRPVMAQREELPRGMGPLVDMLRLLLKMVCDKEDVAQKLVASGTDLEMIAADDNADVPALHGWRRELFGEDALRLKHGKLALAANGHAITLLRLDGATAPAEPEDESRETAASP